MISTGMVTSMSVIITIRALGSDGRLLGVIDRAAACRAVDSLDAKIEPTLPGKPKKPMRASAKANQECKLTADNDGEESKSFIPTHEEVKHYACRTADDHGPKER